MLFNLGRAKSFFVAAVLSVPALLAFALLPQPANATTGINEQINYQARLLDSTGAVVPDGTYNMEFKIYQDGDGVLSGGDETLKWTETRTGADKVTVTNGYFSVQLGSVTAFSTSVDWNQDTLWLSLNIGGTGTPSWDGEMSPFRRLAATAYALNSKQLGGLDWSKFVQVAPSAVQTDSSTLSTLFLNKTGASGNIMQLQKNGTDLLTLGNTGAVTVQNSTNSTSAFKMMNANGDTGVVIDTTTPNLITNHSLESGITGWSAMGSATVSQFTTDSRDGTKSLKVAATTTSDGAKYTYALASSTTYSFSVWGKRALPSGLLFSTIELGRSENGSTNTACDSSNQTFSSDNWARRTCTFTTGAVSGTTYIYVRQSDATVRDWYIDAIQLETGSTVTPYRTATSDITGRLRVNVGPSTTASTAYIQGAGGGGNVLELVGSGENDLFQSILTVKKSDGTSLFNVGETGNGSTFTGGSSFFNSPALQVLAGSSGVRAFDIKGASGQTADLMQIRNSGGTAMISFGANGSATFQNDTNSTTAFSVKNAAGDSLISIDTSGGNQNNLITNPSFETDTTGWAAKGTPTTFARDTTQNYDGSASLKFTTQATADQGAKFNVTLADSTTYNVLFYARLDTATDDSYGDNLSAGYSSDGSTDTNATCSTRPSVALKSTTWQPVRCTFTTASSHSGTPFFYIKSGSAAVETYYIDAVLLQTDANSDSNYRDGKISLQGTIVSPVTIQDTEGQGTFFSIQNSQGSDVFSVTNGTYGGYSGNLITNSDFEMNTVGWTAVGSGTTIQRRPGTHFMGNSSLQIVTGAVADSGAKFVTGNTGPTALQQAYNYRISFYAKSASGTLTDITMAYSYDGNAASEAGDTCTTFSVTTTGWVRVQCEIITNSGNPTSSAYIIIKQETSTSSQSFYVDGVLVTEQFDNVPTGYSTASITMSGTIVSPVTIRPIQDNPDAFAVQNGFGISILQVDTNSKLVYVGDQYESASLPSLLVLDTSSSASDRTGVPNGSMYYSSSKGRLRCYENSIWVNCTNGLNSSVTVVDREDAQYNATITSYGTTASAGTYADAAVAFVAPPSGKVAIHYEASMNNATAGQYALIAPEVRTGNVIGSGTIVHTVSDNDSLQVQDGSASMTTSTSRFILLTGLTVGSDYNVRLLHRVQGGTGLFVRRQVMVQPVW